MQKARNKAGSMKVGTNRIENDPAHHLTGPFLPQTPVDERSTPGSTRSNSPSNSRFLNGHSRRGKPTSFWNDTKFKAFKWAIDPTAAFKLLLVPIVLYLNWELVAPYVNPPISNPFEPLLVLSHRVPTSTDDDPRYRKGYGDLFFLAYHIVFWSFIRQSITQTICGPIARYFGIKKQAKLDRFGEQGYALVYFAFMGTWGIVIMSKLPTWWYRTEFFWIDYPHWDMNPQLKRYYMMQTSYWCQQLIVLILGLEKPRKDYKELVAHHFVTLWLVGWSYLINLTFIGNAIYASMDVPDAFLAFSKLLNYMQWERAKVFAFVIFIGVWTYFRHYLNLWILWGVYNEFHLIPLESQQWLPEKGVWLVWWMKYQILFPITLLQGLNLFWYFLILRILYRSVMTRETTDERSDDEDDGDEDVNAKED